MNSSDGGSISNRHVSLALMICSRCSSILHCRSISRKLSSESDKSCFDVAADPKNILFSKSIGLLSVGGAVAMVFIALDAGVAVAVAVVVFVVGFANIIWSTLLDFTSVVLCVFVISANFDVSQSNDFKRDASNCSSRFSSSIREKSASKLNDGVGD